MVDDHPDAATEEPAPDRAIVTLTPEEILVVAVLRAWVAPHLHPGQPHPDWQDLIRAAGVAAAGAVAFAALVDLLGGHAHRLIDIRCCRCPRLSPDEAAMLRLVASLQDERTLAALDVLADWLPTEIVATALTVAQRYAALLAAAGLRLPVIPGATLRPKPRPWLH